MKDTSRVVVERAAKVVAALSRRMEQHLGIGPNKVSMSPEEVQTMFNGMEPEDRLRFANNIGIEKFMEMMQGVQK